MFLTRTTFALAAALALTAPVTAGAQTTDEPATAESAGDQAAAAGGGAPQVGQTYVAEEHGDWEIRCVRTETGQDPCQLYQLLTDSNGGSVAEVTIFPLPEGAQTGDGPRAEAGATIITPLETLLTQQVTISIDGAEGRRYPFAFCRTEGCYARIALTGDDLAAYRRGNVARLRIVPAAAANQQVVVEISLSGFTAGYAALAERIAN